MVSVRAVYYLASFVVVFFPPPRSFKYILAISKSSYFFVLFFIFWFCQSIMLQVCCSFDFCWNASLKQKKNKSWACGWGCCCCRCCCWTLLTVVSFLQSSNQYFKSNYCIFHWKFVRNCLFTFLCGSNLNYKIILKSSTWLIPQLKKKFPGNLFTDRPGHVVQNMI